MRVAALTMAYNEPLWAPVWARYYASQVGAENCFLLDHGSSDGSTRGLGITVERLARSPLDEDVRARVVGEYVRTLLGSYDAVVHSDADELVVADPRRYADLRAFAAGGAGPVVTAVGLDLQHLPDREPPLDPGRPIGAQRRWVRFSAAMCKPAFVRRPVAWRPGFHGCEVPPEFGELYLIHLRYADLASGLRRLARSRAQAFANAEINAHQRVSDEAFAGMVAAIAALPRERFVLGAGARPLRAWLDRVRAGWACGDPVLSLAGDRLWRLPERVLGLF